MNKNLFQNSFKKHQKTPEFVDTDPGAEQEPAVKCIVMYSTEGEQEPAVKKLQKGLKIPKFAAASCTCIVTSGVRKGKQCRFKASDEIGKFCYHHKPNKHETDQK